MYTKRNSITIGVLLVVLLGIGIFWYSRENKHLKELKIKNRELTQKLDGSLEIAQELDAVEREYRTLTEQWNLAPKQIIAADEPSFSLSYLNWLIIKYNVPVEFDFELKNIATRGGILTFSFLISGEGTYNDLYRLIWFLTIHPLLYQIETFNLKQNQDNNNFIVFSLLIKGFSLIQNEVLGQEFNFDSIRPVSQDFQFYDAFKPINIVQPVKQSYKLIRKELPRVIPKLIDPGLLNIEEANLQAVANGRAYIRNKSGKLIVLKVGDKVRYGSLQNINQKKSEIEFMLEKQGSIQRVILGLGYRK